MPYLLSPILGQGHFQLQFLEWTPFHLKKTILKYVSYSLMKKNKPAFSEMIIWQRPWHKTSSEPALACFTDADMHQSVSMIYAIDLVSKFCPRCVKQYENAAYAIYDSRQPRRHRNIQDVWSNMKTLLTQLMTRGNREDIEILKRCKSSKLCI